jgi:uncharacterized protein (TIGR02611 family)
LHPPEVFRSLRSGWRVLKRGRPGRRFQELHEFRRKQRAKRGAAPRALVLGIGIVLVIVGPIAGMVPGPGGIMVFLGGLGVLASEVTFVARWLDWCEPKVRRSWSRVRQAWRRAKKPARVGACLAAAAVLGMCAFAVHALITSGA